MQDFNYNWAQTYRADTAWRQSYGLWNRSFSKDYKEGWKKGFADISKAGCDEPPPVPPLKYWGACYQSPEGKCCIDEWYNGWRDGAAAAAACGTREWHPIVTAPTVPKDAPHVNTGPGNHPNSQANQPLLPVPRNVSAPGNQVTPVYLQQQPQANVGPNAGFSVNEDSEERAMLTTGTQETENTQEPSGSVGDNYAVPLPGGQPAPVVTSPEDDNQAASTEPAAERPFGSAVETFVEDAKN